MLNDTKPETLPELEKIFLKYSGDHRVYLKIISPKNWETVLSTNRHVIPSEEMLIEVEELLGKERVTLINSEKGERTVNCRLPITDCSMEKSEITTAKSEL
jgi:hypothetical protein